MRPLSVATWNVENFFDTVDDPTQDDVLTAAQFARKRAAVGGILRTLDADVLVVQEIEGVRVTTQLMANELADLGYQTPVVTQGNDPRGINLAVFSRYPIVSVTSHKADLFSSPATGATYRFTRDCLEVEIDVEGVRWVILGVHLRSQLGGEGPDDHRLAEAAQVRAIADRRLQADPTARVIVAGDLNDGPTSATVTRLVGSGAMALADVALSIPIAQRYTYLYSGRPRQYDYILASQGTAPQNTVTTILHDDAVRDASDHFPVRALFRP